MSTFPTTDSEPLISLVYVSAGIRVFNEEDINDILAQSHRNNERHGITGMLLYRDGNFLQVLEGPAAAVESTLQRIRVDPRHRGILVLKKVKIEDRSFSEWTMAFKRIGSAEIKEMEGYSPFMELSFDSEEFKERPEFGYRMLLQFKDKMR
jgi:hypothetical protein